MINRWSTGSSLQASSLTHGSESHSATESPPIQVMYRDADFDPNRIPPSVGNAQTEWSIGSNDSLFSIRVGNNSFSKDHDGEHRPTHHKSSTAQKSEEFLSTASQDFVVYESDELFSIGAHHPNSEGNEYKKKNVNRGKDRETRVATDEVINDAPMNMANGHKEKLHAQGISFTGYSDQNRCSNQNAVQKNKEHKRSPCCWSSCGCGSCCPSYSCECPTCSCCGWPICKSCKLTGCCGYCWSYCKSCKITRCCSCRSCCKWPSYGCCNCNCSWRCYKWPSCSCNCCKWPSYSCNCCKWPSCSCNFCTSPSCNCCRWLSCSCNCCKLPSCNCCKWPRCSCNCCKWPRCSCNCCKWPSCSCSCSEFPCCSCCKWPRCSFLSCPCCTGFSCEVCCGWNSKEKKIDPRS
ncbi:hypothetical protein NMG60_11009353, partial [Bertholletia excelsa]